MPFFDLDYSLLEKQNKITHKLSDVKDQLIRVAFDVVRFQNAPPEELWEIQECDDGDYIVARYNDNSSEENLPKKEASYKSPWETKVAGNEIMLFYKGTSFTKINHPSANTIQRFLPNKLATDKSFLQSLIASLPPARQEEVKNLYPELL